jgi:hypothetical protein
MAQTYPTLLRVAVPLLAAAALLSACSDRQDATAPVPTVDARAARSSAMETVTRALAGSLADQAVRDRVRDDLRDSPFREHKVPLQAYLTGSGGHLLDAMAAHSGKTGAELLRLVGQMPAMEFYMPVESQRDTWAATPDVMVAYQLTESDAPIAYDVSGTRTVLSPTAAPSRPVLTLVPVETNFDHPYTGARLENRFSHGGKTIGTYVPDIRTTVIAPECDPMDPTCGAGGGGDGGGTYTPPSGLYMNLSSIGDLGEAWTKGSPEIEVIVLGPDAINLNAHELTCAGEHSSGARYFNQDNNTWSGSVLIMTPQQVTDYHFFDADPGEKPFVIQLWEDDDAPCVIKTNKDLAALANSAYNSGMGIYHKVYGPTACGTQCQLGVLQGIVSFIRSVGGLISTNDDFIGSAIERNTISNPGYTGYSHILITNADGSSRNGAVNFIYRS